VTKPFDPNGTVAGERSGPLAGYTVIDLSRALAGPHAAMMLGDQGARVIKVEQPGSGDDSRSWGPPFVGPPDAPESTYFMCANRNKESIELDLKSARDIEILAELIRRSDVLIENFRPGVLDRLGFAVQRLAELNPRLVLLSISGFGHDGPEGGRPGYDQIAQGEAGLMSLTGPVGEPMRVGVPIGDLLAGMNGAFGVVSALAERERTGEGRVVRTSLLSAIVGTHSFQGTRYTIAGEVGESVGNHHAAIAPYGAFRCADGVVQVAVANDRQWRKFATVVRIDPSDPRFSTNADRSMNRQELITEIETVFGKQTLAESVQQIQALGIPCGRVRNLAEVYEWEQVHSQGLILDLEHSTVGAIRVPGPALRMEDLDGLPVARAHHQAPPTLGQHNHAIRAWLSGEEPGVEAAAERPAAPSTVGTTATGAHR
jgi:crotonobetainyl-CoA:carnitine CoA-transferase CaiB-like acyl-CoA transferase